MKKKRSRRARIVTVDAKVEAVARALDGHVLIHIEEAVFLAQLRGETSITRCCTRCTGNREETPCEFCDAGLVRIEFEAGEAPNVVAARFADDHRFERKSIGYPLDLPLDELHTMDARRRY